MGCARSQAATVFLKDLDVLTLVLVGVTSAVSLCGAEYARERRLKISAIVAALGFVAWFTLGGQVNKWYIRRRLNIPFDPHKVRTQKRLCVLSSYFRWLKHPSDSVRAV
jgi:hypothetical protein